ncbi:MAG: four helix bundle protein [Planctomycetota bacterium]|nr:four helix bundle protein [Planctomycetota bacterium]
MSKGRLRAEFLERTEAFADRAVAVAEQLAAEGRFARLAEQLAAAACSVGANCAEADQAMSDKDFRKCLAIAAKELAETRFWLRLVVRRAWIPDSRLQPLLLELAEIKLILGTILNKTDPRRRSRLPRVSIALPVTPNPDVAP